jgi:glycosyltransferase involved in cell wall biosynthesis
VTRASVQFLHRALDVVGGAEILLADQARFLLEHGAAPRVRALVHAPAAWDARLGGVPVDAWRTCAPGEPRPRLTRTLGARRLAYLLAELERADAAIAYSYPVSSALGTTKSRAARVWYCLEAPRWLYPEEANPYLAANVARAPERHGPHRYRTSLNSPVGGLPFVGRRRPSRKAADRRGVAGLDAVWALSEYTRDSLARIYPGVVADVIFPMVTFPERPSRLAGMNRDGLRVLSVTRLQWEKNLDTLLDGFAEYRKSDPRATLDIVGTGPTLEPLRSMAAALGQAASVRFHGFLSDAALGELAGRSDVFACLPLDEPFGLIFPEAIARGLLVLGPDHGGPVEILDGGRLGELVDPLDPTAIADGLARLARLSDADADARREAADAACRARFSPDVVGARLLSLLRRHGLALPEGAAA